MDKTVLFRKKSLDRIAEPDQLTDYLRITKPMVWLLLAAILVALSGLLCWSFAGTVEITAEGDAVVSGNQAAVMLADNAACQLHQGMKVYIDGQEVMLTEISCNAFGRPVGHAQITAPDGTYPASVVVKSAHPFRLLFGV